jgi:hypothetical protein
VSCVIVDWENPCEAAVAVRNAYYDLLTNKTGQRLRFRSGESEREITFNPANLAALREELARLEMACAKAKGMTTGIRRVTIAG